MVNTVSICLSLSLCMYVEVKSLQCLSIFQDKDKKEEDINEFVSAVAWRPVS